MTVIVAYCMMCMYMLGIAQQRGIAHMTIIVAYCMMCMYMLGIAQQRLGWNSADSFFFEIS